MLSEDARYLYTSAKEGNIIKWDSAKTGRKLASFPRIPAPPSSKNKGKGKAHPQTGANAMSLDGPSNGHSDEILALAISSDGKYLASGGRDKILGIWDVETDTWIRGFSGHRDIISVCGFKILLGIVNLFNPHNPSSQRA